MAKWSDKNFRVLNAVKDAFEALMDRKGEQMYAISAAMLWYVHAAPERRLDYESSVRRIEQGVGTIGDVALSEEDRAELLTMLRELNEWLEEVSGSPKPDVADTKTAAGARALIARAKRRARQQEPQQKRQKTERKKAK